MRCIYCFILHKHKPSNDFHMPNYTVTSNHQPHDCLLNRLFRCRSKKTSKLRVTGLCVGNSPVTGESPTQRASNAKNVSIWWRHHDTVISSKLHMSWNSCASSWHCSCILPSCSSTICPCTLQRNINAHWPMFTNVCVSITNTYISAPIYVYFHLTLNILFDYAKWLSSPEVGVTKASFVNLSIKKISNLQKYLLDFFNHFHNWHVSPQQSYGDTCQIPTWYLISNVCFLFLKNRKITERR